MRAELLEKSFQRVVTDSLQQMCDNLQRGFFLILEDAGGERMVMGDITLVKGKQNSTGKQRELETFSEKSPLQIASRKRNAASRTVVSATDDSQINKIERDVQVQDDAIKRDNDNSMELDGELENANLLRMQESLLKLQISQHSPSAAALQTRVLRPVPETRPYLRQHEFTNESKEQS